MSFCLIAPVFEPKDAEALLNAFAEHPQTAEIHLIHGAGWEIPPGPLARSPKVHWVPEAFRSLPALINTLVADTPASYLALLPAWARWSPRSLPLYDERFQAEPGCALVFSDYREMEPGRQPRPRSPRCSALDLSPASHTGAICVYRVSAWNAVGGLRPEAGRALRYDLRLRLSERYTLGKLDTATYEVERAPQRPVGVTGWEKWRQFFQDTPGSGDKGFEADTQRVYHQCLKRREAAELPSDVPDCEPIPPAS